MKQILRKSKGISNNVLICYPNTALNNQQTKTALNNQQLQLH